MEFKGASALISGGASGLGEATTRRLHAAGANVVISDLDVDKGEALAVELGDRAGFVEANVMDEAQVKSAVDAAAARDGGLRISVCCAGIGWAQRTASKSGPHDLEIFSNVIKVNLIGTFNVLRLAATRDVRERAGLTAASGASTSRRRQSPLSTGRSARSAYSASKAGIVGLTLPAARDLASRGIRVNTIAPGLFDTPLLAALPEENRQALGAGIPFPSRLGVPDEFAAPRALDHREPDAERRDDPPRRCDPHAAQVATSTARS